MFDEPEVARPSTAPACAACRAADQGAAQVPGKNIPDLQKMAVAFMPLGTQDELRDQIIDVALDRAFLLDPLPTNAQDFERRAAGRARPPDADRQRSGAPGGSSCRNTPAAVRKLKDTARAGRGGGRQQQLQRLVPKNFCRRALAAAGALRALPQGHHRCGWTSCRADPARDAARLAECARRSSATGAWWPSARARWTRVEELRWLLEELRVSFFAQELRRRSR